MTVQARDEILGRLRSSAHGRVAARPPEPSLSEITLDREEMVSRFAAELGAQTGVTHRAAGDGDIERILAEIASAEGIRTVMASSYTLHPGLDLRRWGSLHGVVVTAREDYETREAFRDAAFSADAGITSADFAVAETGTLGIVFKKDQPRLVSIAPPVHVAIVPVENLYPIYETVIEKVFRHAGDIPSQFCFITGPSATADIQAIPFKGMHGPSRVHVILTG